MNNAVDRYMLFSTGGRRYAVNVAAVDEIAELLPEYPIPDSPRFLRGVVNIHGKLAAVLDLSMYLGSGPVCNAHNLLLLKMPDTALAFVVEQMERMILASDIISFAAGSAEFEQTIFTLPEGEFALLNLETLLLSVEKALVS